MYKDLISVIIPVYNVEEYINECVDSVINQTYKNLEIILVDDGSTDNSSKICDEYAKLDKRIKSIHQQNQGAAEARNNGLKVSKGKYIAFIDSDDYVSNDFIYSLYNNLIKNKADISACGYCEYYNNGKINYKNFRNIKRKYNKMEALIFLNVLGYFDVGPWNKLYKKELFDKYKFPKNKIAEDWRIMFKIIDQIDYLYYDSAEKYFYRYREGSVTRTKKIKYDGIEAAEETIQYFKSKNYTGILKYAYTSLLFAYIGVYNQFMKIDDVAGAKSIFKDSKKVSKKITYQYIKPIKKIQLFIFIHFNWLYRIIIKLK